MNITGISPLLYRDGYTKTERTIDLGDGVHWTEQVITGKSGLTLVNVGYYTSMLASMVSFTYFWNGKLICIMDCASKVYTVFVGNDELVENIFIDEIKGYTNGIKLNIVQSK